MYLVFGMVLGLHCVSADLCEFPNVSSVLPNIPACITPSGTVGDVADCHVTSLEGGISSGHQWEYSADNLSGGYNKRTDTTGAIFSGPLRSAVSAVYSELIALIKCMR